MRANYIEKGIIAGKTVIGEEKTVQLPFYNISARALIVRRSDGRILGTLHRKGGKYALPGGAMENGERLEDTIVRELAEENIRLLGSDNNWQERMIVNYFNGYRSLSAWFLFVVNDVEIAACEENIETRWVHQHEDVWYPFMRERILLAIKQITPEHLKVDMKIILPNKAA